MKEAEEVEPFFVGDVPIYFDGYPTLTDGKTKNYWSGAEVAQASCYGCKATPTEMAQRYHEKFDTLIEEAKNLGFANCHLKLAAFRWLKKVCCSREYKKYSRSTKEEYASYDRCEKEMIEAFAQEPIKEMVSKDGRGNNGPLIKRIFSHPDAAASIFHCPEDLLEDLLVIFQTLDCGSFVDNLEFKKFCDNWLDRFHSSEIEYCWLNPTLHFVLHHGWKVSIYFISRSLIEANFLSPNSH